MNQMKDMNPTVYKRKCFLINTAYFLVIGAAVILVIRFALSSLMPFVVAAISSAILRPVLAFLHGKLHMPRKATGAVITIFFYLLIALLGIAVFDKILDTATAFLVSLPGLWSDTLMPALRSIGEWLAMKLGQMNISLDFTVEELLAPLGSGISSLSTSLLGMASGVAFSLPSMLISVIIAIVSTLFMLFDWDRFADFIFLQMPSGNGELARKIIHQVGATIKKFILSYGMIMLITFAELSIGFNIIGIRNAFLIAALISVFDILPVVGCGGILIPWTIISFVIGNTRMGIGLAIIYLFVTVLRNILEPRIVGQQVGLHPLVTLMSMVIGSALMGGVGLFGLPITLAVLSKMNTEGVIHIFRTSSDRKAEKEEKERTISA
ncbi:MAG: sporulation integral membrane protein YtvI [Clostridia bacterium]|nr:sporulation integral membrane protein YtvI [Clostridia bacterium]